MSHQAITPEEEEGLLSHHRNDPATAPIAFAQLASGEWVRVTDPRLLLEAAQRLEAAAKVLSTARKAPPSAVAASSGRLLTLSETAAELRCSPRQVQRYIATGRLRAARATERGGSRVLIERAEVERYLRLLLDP